MAGFVDREKELAFLNERYGAKNAEMIIIYGRRRVGKTELIKQFINGKKALYFLGELQNEDQLVAMYSQTAGEILQDDFLKNNPFKTWRSLFDYLHRYFEKEKIILIFDELPYISRKNKGFLSLLQHYWDERWKKLSLKLILCGSSISMMQKIALSYASPLYGRRTGQIHLQQLDFASFCSFFKPWAIDDKIRAYAVLGGVPRYAEEFDAKATLMQNIERKMLDKDTFLYREAKFLLMEELKDYTNYFAILKAIAYNKNSFNEISNFSGVSTTKLSAYMSKLIDLGIIKREVPVTIKKEKTVRTGNYWIEDNFFRFWFKYIYPNMSLIEIGRPSIASELIMQDIDNYTSRVFENIVAGALMGMSFDKKIEFFNKWGKWWHEDKEIDVVALNEQEKKILFCECKWQDNMDAKRLLAELREKAKYVEWNSEKRKEQYTIFAKSFKEKFKEPNVLLFDLKDIEKLI